MKSISRFLVIVLLAVITLTSFIAAIQGYTSSLKKAGKLFDDQLINTAELLSSIAINPKKYLEQKNIIFQILNDDNELIHSSIKTSKYAITKLEQGFSNISLNGYRWRTYVYRDVERSQWIIVAERIDGHYVLAEQLILSAIYPVVISIPVIGILIWLVIYQGMRPLNKLAVALSLKKLQDLTPVPQENLPKELAQITDSINALFSRLESSFEREKRFSSDAAHELKTPLSALKIHLYNLQKDVAEDNENILMLNISIDRMTRIIEQMLDLYRASPEQINASFTKVDIYLLAQSLIQGMYPLIAAKNQEIELLGSPFFITVNEFSISTLLKNLIDNANKYTPNSGKISVKIMHKEEGVSIVVEDSGPGIPGLLRERSFERFYRVNGDQNNSSVIGCGLGLSIVRHIVDLHHGTVTLEDSNLGGLKVTVILMLEGEVDHA